MKAEPHSETIADLVALHQEGMLRANPEYQRGVVWSETQRKKLIDSVFRGYPLPVIYLHYKVVKKGGLTREAYDVIDGQQRLKALSDYQQGAFKLFDPVADEKKARFPAFLRNQPCPWGGRTFNDLSEELQATFLATILPVARIESDDENEVRDLFVRLQSGLPLNAQETRDALPGDFTDFVLGLGGKPEVPRYPGHEFFKRSLRMKSTSDRGRVRQLAAQIAILYFVHRQNGCHALPDINSASVTEFYYQNIDFERTSGEGKRLVSILDKLAVSLAPEALPKLHGHDAIHMVLLASDLWDDYTPDWQDRLTGAVRRFSADLAQATKDASDGVQNDVWTQYGQWARTSSDKGENIARRHRFYVERMHEYLQPLTRKDGVRLFSELERTILFQKQDRLCAVCDGLVGWPDAEVHHVIEHSMGGQTVIENAALVHKTCHPKGAEKTAAFAEKFFASQSGSA